MAIDVIPVQRRFITEDFPVRDGKLVRQPKVGERKNEWQPICTIGEAIFKDVILLNSAGARVVAEQYSNRVLTDKLIIKPFLVGVSRSGAEFDVFGVYVALDRARLSHLGIAETFSSWYDLYAAPEEADGLQEKVGTHNYEV